MGRFVQRSRHKMTQHKYNIDISKRLQCFRMETFCQMYDFIVDIMLYASSSALHLKYYKYFTDIFSFIINFLNYKSYPKIVFFL